MEKLFIQSVNPDFDFNRNWSKMPKKIESQFTNITKTTKHQLATSRNFQGGPAEMKRSTRIFEKDQL